MEWERVQTLRSGCGALEQRHWDVVLCDHSLPAVRLLQRALRVLSGARRQRTPLIVVSGAIGEETAAAVIREGAADFVNKSNLESPADRRRHGPPGCPDSPRRCPCAGPVPQRVRRRRVRQRADRARTARPVGCCASTERSAPRPGMTRAQLKRTRLQALVDRKRTEPRARERARAARAHRIAVTEPKSGCYDSVGEPRWFLRQPRPRARARRRAAVRGGAFHRDHRAQARRGGAGARPSPGRSTPRG